MAYSVAIYSGAIRAAATLVKEVNLEHGIVLVSLGLVLCKFRKKTNFKKTNLGFLKPNMLSFVIYLISPKFYHRK